jgi:NAD(P)-dependent dehydrogenase (short-subunit alcohol dehydrogenase family)
VGDFQNKIVLVTGAGSGIGRATALAFSAEGARVHLVDVREDRLAEVQAHLRALGRASVAHGVDCTDPQAVERLASEIYAAEGRLDILHNNVGVVSAGPVEQTSLEDWRWVLDHNLWTVIFAIHAFVPRMIAQGGGGHIVNTASMAGLVGLPFVAPYCASKFAVVGLSEALAAELAVHGIGVTAVCPGAVRTNLMETARLRLPGDWTSKVEQLLGRRGTDPEALASDILDAVRSKRVLQVSAGDMAPLWVVKRTSLSLYHHLTRLITRLALKGSGGG